MYRLRGFFVVALLCSLILWSTSIAQAQDLTPTPSTWGSIKAMYDIPDQVTRNTSPGTNSIGSSMGIAWPFVGQSPNDWRGDDGDRTGGANIDTKCGWRNSHSGAEYYARDLSRLDGTTYGQPVGAGINGRVVVAGVQSG